MGGGAGLTPWAARLDGPASVVAGSLLGAVVVSGSPGQPQACVRLRVVEVEAYEGAQDPASHAFRGPGRRNASMFGPPGRAYVYFTYGMHWCLNVVCGPEGVASAVLLRAAEVVGGHEVVRSRRAGIAPRDWARGPARLTVALGIDGSSDGADLDDPAAPLRLEPSIRPLTGPVARGPRVGVSRATDLPWRLWIEGDPAVSAFRAGTRRPRAGGSGT